MSGFFFCHIAMQDISTIALLFFPRLVLVNFYISNSCISGRF